MSATETARRLLADGCSIPYVATETGLKRDTVLGIRKMVVDSIMVGALISDSDVRSMVGMLHMGVGPDRVGDAFGIRGGEVQAVVRYRIADREASRHAMGVRGARS